MTNKNSLLHIVFHFYTTLTLSTLSPQQKGTRQEMFIEMELLDKSQW